MGSGPERGGWGLGVRALFFSLYGFSSILSRHCAVPRSLRQLSALSSVVVVASNAAARNAQTWRSDLVLAFDIETHDWLEEVQKGRIGQFGWCTIKGERAIDFARVVQIGWALGRVSTITLHAVETIFVQPKGFEISTKAVQFHGISNRHAAQEGRPLADTLREFMRVVLEAHG